MQPLSRTAEVPEESRHLSLVKTTFPLSHSSAICIANYFSEDLES